MLVGVHYLTQMNIAGSDVIVFTAIYAQNNGEIEILGRECEILHLI